MFVSTILLTIIRGKGIVDLTLLTMKQKVPRHNAEKGRGGGVDFVGAFLDSLLISLEVTVAVQPFLYIS